MAFVHPNEEWLVHIVLARCIIKTPLRDPAHQLETQAAPRRRQLVANPHGCSPSSPKPPNRRRARTPRARLASRPQGPAPRRRRATVRAPRPVARALSRRAASRSRCLRRRNLRRQHARCRGQLVPRNEMQRSSSLGCGSPQHPACAVQRTAPVRVCRGGSLGGRHVISQSSAHKCEASDYA